MELLVSYFVPWQPHISALLLICLILGVCSLSIMFLDKNESNTEKTTIRDVWLSFYTGCILGFFIWLFLEICLFLLTVGIGHYILTS